MHPELSGGTARFLFFVEMGGAECGAECGDEWGRVWGQVGIGVGLGGDGWGARGAVVSSGGRVPIAFLVRLLSAPEARFRPYF